VRDLQSLAPGGEATGANPCADGEGTDR